LNSNLEDKNMAWDEDDTTIYHVVVNHEEQYSIWPEYKEVPIGWRTVGKSGPKQECLDYIRDVWTDMRPLSLRRHMEEASLQEAASAGKEA
jgi:MbtH protein